MILGIGTDVCDIDRMSGVLQRAGEPFLDRAFTAVERATAAGRPDLAPYYACRFAAKEACAKALGTGITGRVRWTDIQIVSGPCGKPILRLTGGAQARLRRLTPEGHTAVLHVSMADDPPMALAFVVIEARSAS